MVAKRPGGALTVDGTREVRALDYVVRFVVQSIAEEKKLKTGIRN